MADVRSRQEQRDRSLPGTWNRAQFESSLDMLRTLSLPMSAIEYCRRRARETGRLPHEFVTEIIDTHRQGLTVDSVESVPSPAPAGVLPGQHTRPKHRGTRSQLTAEAVLLGLVLLIVVMGMAVALGGLLHHAIANINGWVATLVPP